MKNIIRIGQTIMWILPIPDHHKLMRNLERLQKNSTLPDYYKILDVPRDASQYEIKKRYRELAKKLHPDKSNEEKPDEVMAKINRAYEILSNTKIKKKYDQYLNVS